MISLRSNLSRTILATVIVALLGAIAYPVLAVTLKEEIELGQKLDQEILKQTPLSTDQDAQAEINEYGRKLIQYVRRPEIEYHFRIIKDDDFNAFAAPGGYVYFTERLWHVLRKDERIGVLAHEIVHVDRRHALDALSKARRREIWIAVLLTAVNANRTWADIADLLHSVYTLKYSRADERQADELGVELVHKSGYNPAGLLLAMRKISRFQSERGAEPPKIFSSHPPTPERLKYLESLLTKMNVPVPPDKPATEEPAYRIGDVVAVWRNEVQFVSSKLLHEGDVVWLMTPGWDYYYEKRTAAPAARLVVTKTGSTYSASVHVIPGVNPKTIVKGVGVYDPPIPNPESSQVKLESGTVDSPPRIVSSSPLRRLDRFFARQVVWNKDRTQLVYQNTGYVVVTDPTNPPRYVAVTNPKYSYVPLAFGANLHPVRDADGNRWLGPIISVGRGGETIEVATGRDTARLESQLRAGNRFDVVIPHWEPAESYKDRVVGKAVLKSLSKKIVLQMFEYSPGWSIDRISTGFDIYDSLPDKNGSK